MDLILFFNKDIIFKWKKIGELKIYESGII